MVVTRVVQDQTVVQQQFISHLWCRFGHLEMCGCDPIVKNQSKFT